MIDKIYQTHIDINSTLFKIDNLFKEDIIIDKQVFPLVLDNRQKLSPVDNQGNWPACVAYASCSIAEAYFWKRNGFPCNFDALELYKKCKEVDGMPQSKGTSLEIGLECALKTGIFGKFENNNQEIKKIYNSKYVKDSIVNSVKSILMKYDFMIGGFKITSDYYYLNNSNYFIKSHASHKTVGNHCMTICGWNKRGFIIQNQWGTSFGAKGFFILSYEAFINSFVYSAYITNIYDNLN